MLNRALQVQAEGGREKGIHREREGELGREGEGRKEFVESFKRNPSANFFRKVDANLATSVVSITTWEAIFVALAIRPCQVRKG